MKVDFHNTNQRRTMPRTLSLDLDVFFTLLCLDGTFRKALEFCGCVLQDMSFVVDVCS